MYNIFMFISLSFIFCSYTRAQDTAQSDTAKEFTIFKNDSTWVICDIYPNMIFFALSENFGEPDYISIKYSDDDERLFSGSFTGEVFYPRISFLRGFDISKKEYRHLKSKPILGIRFFIWAGDDYKEKLIDDHKFSQRALYRMEYIPITNPALFKKWIKNKKK
jgi:hypothetical protein